MNWRLWLKSFWSWKVIPFKKSLQLTCRTGRYTIIHINKYMIYVHPLSLTPSCLNPKPIEIVGSKTHQSHSLIHQRYIVRSAVTTRVWCSQCYLLETRIDRQENQFNDYNHQLLNTNISWKTQRILYTTTNFLFWKKKS